MCWHSLLYQRHEFLFMIAQHSGVGCLLEPKKAVGLLETFTRKGENAFRLLSSVYTHRENRNGGESKHFEWKFTGNSFNSFSAVRKSQRKEIYSHRVGALRSVRASGDLSNWRGTNVNNNEPTVAVSLLCIKLRQALKGNHSIYDLLKQKHSIKCISEIQTCFLIKNERICCFALLSFFHKKANKTHFCMSYFAVSPWNAGIVKTCFICGRFLILLRRNEKDKNNWLNIEHQIT